MAVCVVVHNNDGRRPSHSRGPYAILRGAQNDSCATRLVVI